MDIDLEYDLEGKLSNTTEVPFNISGGPPPNVAWLHNGKPYIVPSNSLLFPSGLTAKQFVGMYQVFANNVHSNDSFTIRVLLKCKCFANHWRNEATLNTYISMSSCKLCYVRICPI